MKVAPGFEAVLPVLHERWVRQLLPSAVPAETEATCSDCAMCAERGSRLRGAMFFEPGVKCCTFFPELANFLVGGILLDGDPSLAAGRAAIEQRLAGRVGVTPLGIAPSAAQRLLFERGTRGFGRSRALLCPYFTEEGGGRCTIWRHREATCATWFCKHVRGAVGQRFWHALRILLSSIESSLTEWVLLELEVSPAAVRRAISANLPDEASGPEPPNIDEEVDDEEYGATWGAWRAREREFFETASRRVGELQWSDVQRISGASVALRARAVVDAFQELTSQELPARVRVGALQAVLLGERTRVASYSSLDPLDLPRELVDGLRHFDGRPIEESLRALRADGIELEREALRRLVDFQILVPA